MNKLIKNPILPGFNPDPSICRVGDDYYIATSTFQWFPGVQIFHSKDLVNWELCCRPLNRKSILDMTGIPDSGGVWAPCLSYDNGIFYLVYSNVKTYRDYYKDVDNFVTTASDIMGPWEDPAYLNSSGFDPSLFHDDEGKKYIVNMVWDHRNRVQQFDGICIQEYDYINKKLIGEPVNIFKGTSLGLTEGPHIYKIEGYYYLMCAEGGTYYEHAVTLTRSKSIYGPYEVSPYHPLLTSCNHPELTLQKSGHGSLVETQNGKWYLAHLCGRPNGNNGRCMLGRETSIQKLEKTEDGWFRLANGTNLPDVEVEAPGLPEYQLEKEDAKITFKTTLPQCFQTLRVPLSYPWISFEDRPGYLRLRGKESMESLHYQSLVGRRREDFKFMAETCLEFEPVSYQQMAGMALYYDTINFMYLNITHDEILGRVLSLIDCNHAEKVNVCERVQLETNGKVYLRMYVDNCEATFQWSYDGKNFYSIGPVLDATHLSDDYYDFYKTGLRFTGTFIVLCCQDVSGRKIPADFEYFIYQKET